MVAMLVPESQRSALATEQDRYKSMKARVSALLCENAEDEQLLVDLRAHLQSAHKQGEAARKSVTQHLDAAKRALDTLFRPRRKAIEELLELVSDKLSAYATAQRQARLALLTHPDVTEIPEPTKPAGVTYVERWAYEVVDLAQVDRAFLKLDEKAVTAYLDQYKTSEEIPPRAGLRFTRVSRPRSVR